MYINWPIDHTLIYFVVEFVSDPVKAGSKSVTAFDSYILLIDVRNKFLAMENIKNEAFTLYSFS